MATPFDPKPMPGADKRVILLASAASAIVQAKLIRSYTEVQITSTHTELMSLVGVGAPPLTTQKAQRGAALVREFFDLQTLHSTLDTYLGGLSGWYIGEKQQDQSTDMPGVPVEVVSYIKSIEDGVPYVAPTKTGA